MFGKHVTEEMSAYAHGELARAESERVAAHIEACEGCRRAFDEIRRGIRLAETLPLQAAPHALWEALEIELAKEHGRVGQPAPQTATLLREEQALPPSAAEQVAPTSWLRSFFDPRAGSLRPRAMAVSLLLLVTVVGGSWWFSKRSARPPVGARDGWEVARLEGAPRIDANAFGERGRLAVGEWLETDAHSRARIKVANIGQVEVAPETRIRLVETRQTEHRIELQRGRMSAVIYAPPRLFFVNTPSAVAADLGCAYTLEVDGEGRSLLHVTAGWVALEASAGEAFVPAGASCLTKPGAGVGTPFFEDAPPALLAALSRFDFEGGGAQALASVLRAARTRDTLTLWHLLSRVEGRERARVYARLSALAPAPAGVTREGVLDLDPSMLDAWKEHLETVWMAELERGLPISSRNLRQ